MSESRQRIRTTTTRTSGVLCVDMPLMSLELDPFLILSSVSFFLPSFSIFFVISPMSSPDDMSATRRHEPKRIAPWAPLCAGVCLAEATAGELGEGVVVGALAGRGAGVEASCEGRYRLERLFF